MERSKDAAKTVLEALVPNILAGVSNEVAAEILKGEIVAEVFEVAWSCRFEDDRRNAQRRIRQLIADAIKTRQIEALP